MTQEEIAFRNVLEMVAIGADTVQMDRANKELLIDSVYILGERAGLTRERQYEIAEELRQQVSRAINREEN